jgi:hypothetical protein
MKRRDFLQLAGGAVSVALRPELLKAHRFSGPRKEDVPGKLIGMYIHQHWPYKHPYAARTWTVEDYRGYADGLKKIGYNMIMIWPVVETMPDPLTPSDSASLEKLGKVIDMLHHEFGMQAYIALCPNVGAKNEEAAKYAFERRHFFACDMRVNPGDAVALERMIKWREKLFRPLAEMDGLLIADSDPGGYPGSNNSEFVNLLGEHRKMLDRLRPGIELCYFMHAGWEGYSRYYETGEGGNSVWGTPAEAVDVLTRLKKLDPKPWSITTHTADVPPNGTNLQLAEKFGLAATAVAFNYGAIEYEPSFPMTNFGNDNAFNSGQAVPPGGTIANAQTHCVQLPNTYAFARGAVGKTIPTETDYIQFAEDLIVGQGRLIAQGWRTLSEKDTHLMRTVAGKIDALPPEKLIPGPLKGLLFGSPLRFMTDLAMELRMKAAYDDFVAVSHSDRDSRESFRVFVAAAAAWQDRHGYECAWRWPDLSKALRKVNSASINSVLDEKAEGNTPYDRVEDRLLKMETYTSRLIEAMKKTVASS